MVDPHVQNSQGVSPWLLIANAMLLKVLNEFSGSQLRGLNRRGFGLALRASTILALAICTVDIIAGTAFTGFVTFAAGASRRFRTASLLVGTTSLLLCTTRQRRFRTTACLADAFTA